MRVFKQGFNIIKNYKGFNSLGKKMKNWTEKCNFFYPFRYFLPKNSFLYPQFGQQNPYAA